MNKNVFFCVDYMCQPVYSGESFKDAMVLFRQLFAKYSYMIEADICVYYHDNIAALAFTRLRYPHPEGARLVIGKRGADFTAKQKQMIAANVATLCREYGLMLRSDILERMKSDAQFIFYLLRRSRA